MRPCSPGSPTNGLVLDCKLRALRCRVPRATAGGVPGCKVAPDHHRVVVIRHGRGQHHGTCMNSLSVIVEIRHRPRRAARVTDLWLMFHPLLGLRELLGCPTQPPNHHSTTAASATPTAPPSQRSVPGLKDRLDLVFSRRGHAARTRCGLAGRGGRCVPWRRRRRPDDRPRSRGHRSARGGVAVP
jgi:hypothetical protein